MYTAATDLYPLSHSRPHRAALPLSLRRRSHAIRRRPPRTRLLRSGGCRSRRSDSMPRRLVRLPVRDSRRSVTWRADRWRASPRASAPTPPTHCAARSEEHTSELQSLMPISYAVFCLKKKTHNERYELQSERRNKTTIYILQKPTRNESLQT